jgi:hypothetical protein
MARHTKLGQTACFDYLSDTGAWFSSQLCFSAWYGVRNYKFSIQYKKNLSW